MNRRYRKTLIAGNLKMNTTVQEVRVLADSIKAQLPKVKWCDICFIPPLVNIDMSLRALRDSRISVGAQNCYYEKSGAYTGEVSAEMLSAIGCKYCIVGHSERRRLFGETDEMVNLKVKALIDADVNPIVCVGETQAQKDAGVTKELIALQVKSALNGISTEKMKKIVIAYEPVWAIGTGLAATAEDAQNVCAYIRDTVKEIFDAKTARSTTILYGGSMNEKNAADLLSRPDIDGGLIGGASLDADRFMKIVEAANQ